MVYPSGQEACQLIYPFMGISIYYNESIMYYMESIKGNKEMQMYIVHWFFRSHNNMTMIEADSAADAVERVKTLMGRRFYSLNRVEKA